jgi:hypothetical protein
MVFSHLAGREVSNYSPEWLRECECRHLINKYPTRAHKHYHLYGATDRKMIMRTNAVTGKEEVRTREELREMWGKEYRPVMFWRGLQAADELLADAKRLHDLTNKP